MILKLLKPFSFLPAIFLMYMIYSFSAQDGETSAALSYKVSYKIVEAGGEILGADLQTWEIDSLAQRFHTPVRKLAHMSEYFLLAIAVAFPLYVYGLRGILLLLAAGMICVGFACGDEYHQAHVAGRGPSKRDVLIDSVGVFFGIVLVRIIGWTGRNTIFRPFAHRKKRNAEQAYAPAYPNPPSPPAPDGQLRQPYGDAAYTPYPKTPQRTQRSYFEASSYGPSYGNYPQESPDPYDEDEDFSGTSDRLSEDMSFRKLVSDLKDQKQTRRRTQKSGFGKSDTNID